MQRILALAVLLLVQLGPAVGGDKYQVLGPTETLDNGLVTVEVALQIGRVTSYARKGEPNWLSINDSLPTPGWHWNPWGGDRIWPTSQSLFAQIYHNNGCDPVIDGAPWTLVTKTRTRLEMKSGISPELGLQITRRIDLVPNSTEVIHAFRLERVKASPFPVHLWNITAVRAGDYLLLESDPAIEHPANKPFKWWPDASPAEPKAALLKPTRILDVPWPTTKVKLGTYGRWIALVSGGAAFIESISYDSRLPYLDGSSLQTYIETERHIYEMETLSPTWFLKEGESQEWKVRWKLIDFPDGAKSKEARAGHLNSLVRETEAYQGK